MLIVTDSGQINSSRMSLAYSRLLSEEDLNRVRDKFHEDIDFVLEDAIRKHVSHMFMIANDECSTISKRHQFHGGSTYCWPFSRLTTFCHGLHHH